jgi:hypothetical protein
MIVLPQTHRIIEYFPFLNHCNDINFNNFKLKVNQLINTLSNIFNEFNLIYTNEHINHRYPLVTPFFIKDFIYDKSMLHIGAKNGELDVGFLKYCSKLISVELCNHPIPNINNEKYTYITNTDYKDIIETINVDVYYFWCGYQDDIIILDNLINIYNKKGTFFIGVPQQDDKLCSFLNNLKNFIKKNNVEIDYCPIIFDESNIKINNPTQFTIDNTYDNWNNWKTFNNMKGVLFLIKIITLY